MKRIIINNKRRPTALKGLTITPSPTGSKPKKILGRRQPKTTHGVKFAQPPISSSVFFTGGIGDVFAVESFFTEHLKHNLSRVCFATNKRRALEPLFKAAYPNADHITVWDDFEKFWTFFSQADAIKCCHKHNIPVSRVAQEADDFSIGRIFQMANARQMKYTYSIWLAKKLCDLTIDLPEKFVFIAPCSSDKRVSNRDFSENDWQNTIKFLENNNITGVVINAGQDHVPEHNLLLNLTNKTTIVEAVEILKKSSMYIGIDSCFSVLAAKLFDANRLLIKCVNGHGLACKHIYFAPHIDFKFIKPRIETSHLTFEKFQGDEITVTTMQGLGDIFWVYQKLSPYFKKININIGITGQENLISKRSHDWLFLLPQIGEVKFKSITNYESIYQSYHSIITVIDQYNQGKKEVEYCVNRWLEEGFRLEDIDLKFDVAIDVPVAEEVFDLPYSEYLTFYVSGHAAKKPKGIIWHIKEWCDLLDLFLLKKGKMPVVLLGAEFDKDSIDQISKHLIKSGVPHTSIIQNTPARVAYLLRNSTYFIGYQSGLNIMADNFNVKQYMVYYDYLKPMKNTWCKKEHAENGLFNAFLFSQTPQEVANLIA